MKDEQFLKKQAKDLEEAFFAQENERLLRELREKAKADETRKSLGDVIKVKDPALIDHLFRMGVRPESVLALSLVPLAAVSWADGSLDDKERKAILKAASERGAKPGSAGYTMLEVWLKERPHVKLMDAWKEYARGVWEQLSSSEKALMRERILGEARDIAKAAGGFLGLASVTPQEKALLEELEKVFV
jgi:hypothetical protein